MTTRPSAAPRRQIMARAHQCCEYCLVPQDLAASTHQVDHVIAEKHGGQTVLENLALSCMVCNRRKASDISSLDPLTGALVPLFNPRTQLWLSVASRYNSFVQSVAMVGGQAPCSPWGEHWILSA